jgi:hypothetical protein
MSATPSFRHDTSCTTAGRVAGTKQLFQSTVSIELIYNPPEPYNEKLYNQRDKAKVSRNEETKLGTTLHFAVLVGNQVIMKVTFGTLSKGTIRLSGSPQIETVAMNPFRGAFAQTRRNHCLGEVIFQTDAANLFAFFS